MVEALQEAYLQYQARMTQATDRSQGKSLTVGKEIDREFIHSVCAVHARLASDQALILRVALGQPDEDYQELDGYAGFVHDAPIDFARILNAAVLEGKIKFSGDLDFTNLPTEIEIVVPTDILQEEDLGENTSASRAAVTSGAVRNYIHLFDFRTPYFSITQTGVFLHPHIEFHPSIVRCVRTEPLTKTEGKVPHVIFRQIVETE